jgi:Uma2 family endonuclease
MKTPAPRFEHQFVLANTLEFLKSWLEKEGRWRAFLAPIDLVAGSYDVVQPDIMVLAMSEIDRFRDIGIVVVPPRVVVEVLSPGTANVDLRAKRARHAQFGVTEYWTIDPGTRETNIFVLESDISSRLPVANDGSVASRALPGCVLDPGVVFPNSES